MSKILTRQYARAKKEGRLCSQCQWMIKIKNWKKGYRLCPNCYITNKGVSCHNLGYGPYRDEPREITGEVY